MPSSVDNELQQIADSPDPVNLGWQTAVGAIAILVLLLVLA
jgi:hypothetical protein